MRVLLTGASGFIGTELLKELRDRGHEVVATSSRDRESDDPGVTWIKADMTSARINRPNYWRAVVRAHKIDAIINNAGIFEERPERDSTFDTVNFHGAVAMAEGAERAGVSRFIQMSSAVAGKSYAGKVGYGSSKRQADDFIQSKTDLNWTIVRPDIVYSAESWGHDMSMDEIAAMPVVPILGQGNTRMQPIHVSDIAKAARLVESDEAKHQVLDASGPDSIKMIDLLRTLKEARGERFRTRQVPLRVAEAWVANFPKGAANHEFIQMLREEIQVVTPHHDPEPYAEAIGVDALITVAKTYANPAELTFKRPPVGDLLGQVWREPGKLGSVLRDLVIGVRDKMAERRDDMVRAMNLDSDATKRALGLVDNDEVTLDELRERGAAPRAEPEVAPTPVVAKKLGG